MTNQVLESEVIKFEHEIPLESMDYHRKLLRNDMNQELIIETTSNTLDKWRLFSTIKYREDRNQIMRQNYKGYEHKGDIVAIIRESHENYAIDSTIGRYFSKVLNKAGIQNG